MKHLSDTPTGGAIYELTPEEAAFLKRAAAVSYKLERGDFANAVRAAERALEQAQAASAAWDEAMAGVEPLDEENRPIYREVIAERVYGSASAPEGDAEAMIPHRCSEG